MVAPHLSGGFQGTLWGAGPLQVPEPVQGVRWLDGACWVIEHAGWLQGGDAIFDDLRGRIAWRDEERPMYDRVVAVPRQMAAVTLDDEAPAALRTIADALGSQLGVSFDRVGLNLYRCGRDSVAWHSDRLPRGHLDDGIVALVSLGGARTLRVRPKAGSSSPVRGFDVRMHSGDLFVMGGACQRRWEHCVPKAQHAEPRISLAFRSVGPATLPPRVRERRPQGCHH